MRSLDFCDSTAPGLQYPSTLQSKEEKTQSVFKKQLHEVKFTRCASSEALVIVNLVFHLLLMTYLVIKHSDWQPSLLSCSSMLSPLLFFAQKYLRCLTKIPTLKGFSVWQRQLGSLKRAVRLLIRKLYFLAGALWKYTSSISFCHLWCVVEWCVCKVLDS